DDLAGVVADDVDAAQLLIRQGEEKLEQPPVLADEYAARVGVVPPAPNRVRHTLRAQALLGLPYHRDLWDRPDPDGQDGAAVRRGLETGRDVIQPEAAAEGEGVVHRQPRLLHRGRRQGVSTDHVASRIDVRDIGLEVLVHQKLTVLVQAHAGILEAQAGDIAAAAQRDEERLGLELLARAEMEGQSRGRIDALDAVRQVKLDADRLHRLAQEGPDPLVGEWQDRPARVEDPPLVQAQPLEQARILAADGAAPRDRQRSGQPLHVRDRVRVVHARSAERVQGGTARPGAGRDEYDAALE